MPGYFLNKVSVEGFRGINNANDPLDMKFDPQKVNSVFGVNGLGKSSIFEALTYAIRGKIVRLDEMHRDELPSSYYNNCFHPTRTATIILTLVPDDGSSSIEVMVKRASSGVRTISSPTGHPDPEAFLKSLDNPFLLLDQATFLRFVADTPLNRGRSFSSLLGLAEISEMRQILQVLSNAGNLKSDLQLSQIESRIKSLAATIRDLAINIKSSFEEFYKEEIQNSQEFTKSPDAVVVSLASVPLLHEYCSGKSIFELNFVELEKCISIAENSEQRHTLSRLISTINNLNSLATSEAESTEFVAFQEIVATLNANLDLTEGQDYYAMLNAVKKVIISPEWGSPNECPACDSNLSQPLLPEIDEGLNAYNLVDDSKKLLSSHWTNSTWPNRLRRLEESLAIPDSERKHEAFHNKVSDATVTSEDTLAIPVWLTALEALRIEKLTSLNIEKNIISSELPASLVSLTSKVKAAENLSKLIPNLASAIDELKKIELYQSKCVAWDFYINQAATIFSSAESALSTKVAESLEAKYQEFYVNITKNPEIVPVLERSQGSEDLSLRLKRFHTLANIPAASLLPESYRNALGISIYLSAAVQSQAVARFIVLDDITSSFDAGHQFALMELIRTTIAHQANVSCPQVVILSHDGLLEKYFDKIASQGLWHHHKLQGIPPTGMLLSHNQAPDRLRKVAENHLNVGQISVAEPIIRQYLEFVLLQIIRKVGIYVPMEFAIQDDRKMVGNAIEHIKQSINLHKKANILILTTIQESDFLTVHSIAIIGNWVTHYETGSMGVFNAPTLFGVIATIDMLKTCFQYQCICNGTPQPTFYKSLAAKHCNC